MQPYFPGMKRITMWTNILQIAQIWLHLRLVQLTQQITVLTIEKLNPGQNWCGLNGILLRECSHDAHVSLSIFPGSFKTVVDTFSVHWLVRSNKMRFDFTLLKLQGHQLSAPWTYYLWVHVTHLQYKPWFTWNFDVGMKLCATILGKNVICTLITCTADALEWLWWSYLLGRSVAPVHRIWPGSCWRGCRRPLGSDAGAGPPRG